MALLCPCLAPAQDWASGVVAFMPLITAEIVLGLPPVLSHLRARTQSWGATKVWAVALPITFLWTVSGLIKGRGSALSCIFVALLIAGVIGACVEVGSGTHAARWGCAGEWHPPSRPV